MDLRCENGILFGTLEDGVLEVKCRSVRCGHGAGVVILHRFDALTGKALETRRFKDASYDDPYRKKVNTSDSARSVAIRPS